MAHLDPQAVRALDTSALAAVVEGMGCSAESLSEGNAVVEALGGWEIVAARLTGSETPREVLLGDVVELAIGVSKNADLFAHMFYVDEKYVVEMGAAILNKACTGRLVEAAANLSDLAEALCLHYEALAERCSDTNAGELLVRWQDVRSRLACTAL